MRTDREKNIYYAPFKLGVDGETVCLSDPAGNLLDTLSYPAQYGNVSYGRLSKTGEYGFFNVSTPQSANDGQIFASRAARPEFDLKPGFYENGVTVGILSDAPVYYTLDGSEPTMASARYTAPIQISKTTVLRARACPDDALMSPVAGVTYIIGDPAVTPVVSLSTDEKYLYDSKIGIFVCGSNATSNYEQDWEYPVHLEYFDENGEECLNQTGSFHIVGTSTRGAKQKSIAVYARTAYGDGDRFCYNPFENRDYESYKTLILRSSGSDAMGARMRDAVLTSMVDGLDLMYQASRPVVVYMNGVYMGHYNLREKINKYSVAQWEGVTKKAILTQSTSSRARRGTIRCKTVTMPIGLRFVSLSAKMT